MLNTPGISPNVRATIQTTAIEWPTLVDGLETSEPYIW